MKDMFFPPTPGLIVRALVVSKGPKVIVVDTEGLNRRDFNAALKSSRFADQMRDSLQSRNKAGQWLHFFDGQIDFLGNLRGVWKDTAGESWRPSGRQIPAGFGRR